MKFKMILLAVALGVFSPWAAGTWTAQNSGTMQSLRSIACPTVTACYVVGDAGAYVTKAVNGDTWNYQYLDNGDARNYSADLSLVSFADSMTGYIAAKQDLVLKTTNKGVTWTSSNVGGHLGIIWRAIHSNSGQVYIIGLSSSVCPKVCGITYSSHVFKQGLVAGEWNQAEGLGSGGGYYDINPTALFFVNATTGYAVAGGAVYKTLNGGGTYSSTTGSWGKQTVAPPALWSIHFINANQGALVGDSGAIYTTTDAGVHWSPEIWITTKTLRAVHFIDVNTGYAVGDSGTILETGNGGATWIARTPITSANLNAVAFAGDGSTGYAVGDNGVILKLTGGTPSGIAARRVMNPNAGVRRIGDRWYGFSMPDGRVFDSRGRQGPVPK